MPPSSFDSSPLTAPVDSKDVRTYAAALRARGANDPSVSTILMVALFAVAGLVFVPLMFSLFLSITGGNAAVVIVVMAVVVALIAVFGYIAWFGTSVTRYRLHRFAEANGMEYTPKETAPARPGMIFDAGHSRMSTDIIHGTRPRFVEFANYQYTEGSGKNSTTYHWGYIAVRLDVPLPNIVLDATGNNGFGTNLPARFQKSQRLSLEGDFDRYFDLYCPDGYEADALYLFTPDIMARFIDNAAQLDVEIVDDWMFLYTQRKVSTLDPATWAWLFGVVGALTSKLEQWARWRDERLREVEQAKANTRPTADAAASAPQTALPFAPPAGLLTPPPGVAQQGRRLKRSFSWLPIVVIAAFALFWLWSR